MGNARTTDTEKSYGGLRNGAHVDRRRLVVGQLPPKLVSCQREGRGYRRDLEEAVLDAKGKISVSDAHLIDTASAATLHAAVCRWLLRERFDEMSTADIRECSKAIVRAKADRDAAVSALNLDAPPPDPWAAYDAAQHADGRGGVND